MKRNVLESAPRTVEDDLFYKYSRNLSNDVNGSLESSDLSPFFFQTKTNARGCFEEGLAYPSAPFLSSFTVYSLVAIYPAKSYFRWKFIALARIEASFPGERNKESAMPADLALRSKNNWRPLLSPFSLPPSPRSTRSDKSIAKLANVNRQLKVRDVSAYLSCAP